MTINVKRIENMLAERGITKSELSKSSGVSAQTLSMVIRRGTCEPKTAGKIAAGLNVSVEEIAG